MTRLIGPLILMTWLTCGPLAAADQLAERAEATQAEAEAALTATRTRVLAERTRLVERLAAVGRSLEAARTETEALAIRQRQGAARLAGVGEEERKRQEHLTQTLEQAAAACGLAGQVRLHDLPEATTRLRAALASRFERLAQGRRLRVETTTIANRSGQPVAVPVLRLGTVQRLAAGGTVTDSGLVLEGTMSRVAGPRLSPPALAALRSAAKGSIVRLPCDVSASLAGQQEVSERDLWAWLVAGGIFVWPILGVMLAALLLALERSVALLRLRVPLALADQVLDLLARGQQSAAQALVADSRTPLSRLLAAGLAVLGAERPAREAALEAALLAEEPRFERSLSLLAVLAAVAPMLGLLGTVSGMITTFEVIAVKGTGNPRLLSGGISEAMITTQLGLMAAVPIILVHAALSRIVDRRLASLEKAATALLGPGASP